MRDPFSNTGGPASVDQVSDGPGGVRTRIKICGLTCLDDAMRAAELGVDALGFVFAPGSRRRAEIGAVARITRDLPPFATLVGVFQDQPAIEVRRIAVECGLDLVQLHGSEDAGYVRDLGLKVLKAVSLAHLEDVGKLVEYPEAHAFLLDSKTGGAVGGTGKTFEWSWALEAKRFGRVVLAGGLGPQNVAEAIRRVRPWAVDSASGTECAPGRKDPKKLRQFVEQVREADRRLESAEGIGNATAGG